MSSSDQLEIFRFIFAMVGVWLAVIGLSAFTTGTGTVTVLGVIVSLVVVWCVIGSAGGLRYFWRIWRPYFVALPKDYRFEEIKGWLDKTVPHHEYFVNNFDHVVAFKHKTHAATFKLRWNGINTVES